MNEVMDEIKKRPHPVLVHFPIAFYPLSLVFLVLFWVLDSSSYLLTSYWCFLGAAFFVVPVAITGWHDMVKLKKIDAHAKQRLGVHYKNGVAITIISIVSGLFFLWQKPFENQFLFVLYTLNLFLLVGLVSWQGYLGAKLVYDHHLGVSGDTR